MPSIKVCRLKFMQDLLTSKRKMIRIELTNNWRIPSSPEFSVKFILKGKFIKGSYIEEYFPDPPETIDRRFLWAAWFAFDEDNAEKYFARVLQTKVKKREPPKTV